MRFMAVVLVASSTMSALLAGCSDSAPEAAPQPTDAPTSSASAVAPPPVRELLPFSFDGSLPTLVHGCVFPAGVCPTQVVAEDTSDFFVERPGANLTGLVFDVTWQAQTPATATLTIGAMVMATCDGCNNTLFTEVTGASPLHVDVGAVEVPLTADFRVHIYAYNPTGIVILPADVGYAVVGVQQAIHVEGVAEFLVPATSSGLPA